MAGEGRHRYRRWHRGPDESDFDFSSGSDSASRTSAPATNKEIANKLHIPERTVKFHVSNLLNKLGVRRRADLILLCYQRRSASA